MNFAEVRFWEYLLIGLGVLAIARFAIRLASPSVLPVFDKLALLALGLSLLVCMSWVTFVIFLVVAVGTYFGLGWIVTYHGRHASKYLLLLIPLQLLPENLNVGASWIALGLFFKCCLADNLNLLFNRSSDTNPFLVWLANILFGLRIYYDFAGYSLIAVGLARCLGIKLTLNFLSPYCSTSIVEFWHRWHVTLSQWFRDYVYVPLGGN